MEKEKKRDLASVDVETRKRQAVVNDLVLTFVDLCKQEDLWLVTSTTNCLQCIPSLLKCRWSLETAAKKKKTNQEICDVGWFFFFPKYENAVAIDRR